MKQYGGLVTIVLCRVNIVNEQNTNVIVISDDNGLILLLTYFL